MKPSSPTLEGFRTILRQPSLGLAEIAWRWSFGAAAITLGVMAGLEYLDTLTVTRGDLLLLRTRQPTLISQAMAHIFHGSAVRVLETTVVLAMALAAGWILIAALGRAATIGALLDHCRRQFATSGFHPAEGLSVGWSLGSLLGLNFLRAGLALAGMVGFLAAFILGGAASPTENPAPGAAFLIMLGVMSLVWLVWSVLNWFLSLAAIFVVKDGRDISASLAATIDLCRNRAGSVLAAGTWFGLAHVVAFFLATTAVAFPLGLASVLPRGVTLGGVLLITLLYFALVDFLYMGRLAAYVAMLELPDSTVTESPKPPLLDRGQPSAVITRQGGVDPDELILSDLPAPGLFANFVGSRRTLRFIGFDLPQSG